MATMRLEIVSAERVVYSEEVSILVAPGADGELGILPRHAPLLSASKARRDPRGKGRRGKLHSRQREVSWRFWENKVTILADAAEHAEGDRHRAHGDGAEAGTEESVESGGSDADLERAMASIRRSQARLTVARRRRRPREGSMGPPPG